jgi:hypothetical protein
MATVSPEARRVILLGKGTLAVRAAEWFLASPRHRLELVVPVIPEPAWTDSLAAFCREQGVPVVDRILNLHNGPLPRYRGVSPINWALKNGETSHGVTIHEITEGIDDGPIVAQATYSIHPDIDEVVDVYHRALRFGQLLFEETMPRLDEIHARPQDHSAATYYSGKQNALLGDRRGFTRAQSA